MATDSNMTGGVAGRYASALFDLAKDSSAVSKVEADLSNFKRMLDGNADLMRMVRSPVLSQEDQVRAVGAVLDKVGIDGLAANFIKVLAGNRRLFAVSDMIAGYKELAAADRGEVTAHVTSAEALSDEQIAELKATLKSSVGKDVMLDSKVDPSLLGGLIVKLGSRMIDSSLRTKLQALKINLNSAGA